MRRLTITALIITLLALNVAAYIIQSTCTGSAQGAVYKDGKFAPPAQGGGSQQYSQGGQMMQQGQMQQGQMQQGQFPMQGGQMMQQGQISTQGAQQLPTSPIPGQMPGVPGKQQSGDWNLSELLYGIMQLDKTKDRLSKEQARRILPLLTKVVEATTLITDTETVLRTTLTKEQLAFIKEAQRKNALRLDKQLPAGKPGEDPLVAYVIGLLEKKTK